MLSVECFSSGFAVICNRIGSITQNLGLKTIVGTQIYSTGIMGVLRPESQEKWHALVAQHDNSYCLTWHLLLAELEGNEYPCLATAISPDEILVIGVQGENAFASLYGEMQSINSNLTNRLRSLYKHLSLEDANLYQEISRINNELINTKRELQKKTQELKAMNLQLEELAITDPLTGLYNRRYFRLQEPQIIARALRNKTNICVAMCDINDFKRVNDTYGHNVGDNLLQHLAHCLQSETRQGQDTAFRIGGDEFLVVMEQCDDMGGHTLLERVANRFSQNAFGTSMALGSTSASWKDLGTSLDELVSIADKEMYIHKAKIKESSNESSKIT